LWMLLSWVLHFSMKRYLALSSLHMSRCKVKVRGK
jgi:hypothetical protein